MSNRRIAGLVCTNGLLEDLTNVMVNWKSLKSTIGRIGTCEVLIIGAEHTLCIADIPADISHMVVVCDSRYTIDDLSWVSNGILEDDRVTFVKDATFACMTAYSNDAEKVWVVGSWGVMRMATTITVVVTDTNVKSNGGTLVDLISENYALTKLEDTSFANKPHPTTVYTFTRKHRNTSDREMESSAS